MPHDRETSSKIEDLEDEILYLKIVDQEHWDEREKQSEALDQAESRIKELEKQLVTHDAKQVSEEGADVHGTDRQQGETGTPITISLDTGGSLFRVVVRAVRQDPDDCEPKNRDSQVGGGRLHYQGLRESGGSRGEKLSDGVGVERGSDRQPTIPNGMDSVCDERCPSDTIAAVVARITGTGEPDGSQRRTAESPDARVGDGPTVQTGSSDGTTHANCVGGKPICFNQITKEARGFADAFHDCKSNDTFVKRLGEWLSADPPAFFRLLPPLITVDFDGVMVSDQYPGVGKMVNKGLRDLLTVLQVWGVHTTANTCREGTALDVALPVIESWLHLGLLGGLRVNENSPERVEFCGGDCRKISADLYIEDRALGWPSDGRLRTVWLLLWCKRNLCWSDQAMGLRFRETPLW